MSERVQDEVFHALTTEVMDLLINVGLINSISGEWPEVVQRNWAARMSQMGEWASHQIAEVQEFASAYD